MKSSTPLFLVYLSYFQLYSSVFLFTLVFATITLLKPKWQVFVFLRTTFSMNAWFIIIRGIYADMAKVFIYRKQSIKWMSLQSRQLYYLVHKMDNLILKKGETVLSPQSGGIQVYKVDDPNMQSIKWTTSSQKDEMLPSP